MNRLKPSDLAALIEAAGAGPRVSIYMPLEPGDSREDRPRLQGLLRRASEDIRRLSGSREAGERVLGPAYQRLRDGSVLRGNGARGLALFLAPETARHYHLPEAMGELAFVGERFHIKPLVRVFGHGGRWYVVEVTRDRVRFYEAWRHGIAEVELPPGVPASKEALEGAVELQPAHGGGRPAARAGTYPGPVPAVGRGSGGAGEDPDRATGPFLRRAGSALGRFLLDDSTPVVLAGKEGVRRAFRSGFRHPCLVDDAVDEDPGALSEEDLRARSRAAVAPWFWGRLAKAKDRYLRLAGTGGTTCDLREVLRAAHEGRIETLIVAGDLQLWGRYDRERGVLREDRVQRPGSVDVLDVACEQVIGHGGEAHVVPWGDVPSPGSSPVAGVLRR